ncbi:3-hydroxyacyl-CoA dehydrogenase NAD-binding domain-containing protein, partial [Pseudomonas sp. BAgro211]|nr:3-hydroxyacyl-CoA dehydrogenase NAD-binding domain-containing protein [Pseudomonas sp. BAgro211]
AGEAFVQNAIRHIQDTTARQLGIAREDVLPLSAKQALLAELEAVVSAECILATNTSSLSVTSIARGCQHPQRVAGFHFFNPVPLMKVVEVIDGLASDPQVGDSLVALAARMGHRGIRAK